MILLILIALCLMNAIWGIASKNYTNAIIFAFLFAVIVLEVILLQRRSIKITLARLNETYGSSEFEAQINFGFSPSISSKPMSRKSNFTACSKKRLRILKSMGNVNAVSHLIKDISALLPRCLFSVINACSTTQQCCNFNASQHF